MCFPFSSALVFHPLSRSHTARRLRPASLLTSVALTALAAAPAPAQMVRGYDPPTVIYDNETYEMTGGPYTDFSGSVLYVTGWGNSILVSLGGGSGIVLTAMNTTGAGVVDARNGGRIELGSGAVITGSGFGSASGIVGTTGILATLSKATVVGANVTITLTGDSPFGIYAFDNGQVSLTGLTDITIHANNNAVGSNTTAEGVYARGTASAITLEDVSVLIDGYNGSTTRVAQGLIALDTGTVTVTGRAEIDILGQKAQGVISELSGHIHLNSVDIHATGTTTEAYGFLADDGAISAGGDAVMSVNAKTNARGIYATNSGAITLDGAADITAAGNTATGVDVANGGTATLSGNAEFRLTGTTTATGIGVSKGGQVTLSGGSNFIVSGDTAYGISTSGNNNPTTPSFVSLTGATMTVNGSSAATSIYAAEGEAAVHTMHIDATGSTFNSSGSGIVMIGTMTISLTDSTMNNGNGEAFDVAARSVTTGGGRSPLPETTTWYMSELTMTADNSRFNGSAATETQHNSVFDLTMTNNSEWTDASGNLTHLTLEDSSIRFPAPAGNRFHTLTVNGFYRATNGHIFLNTRLDDGADPTATDLLHVELDTIGTTTLHVANAGGSGALTTGNGIMVVRVDGVSDGTFELAGDYVTPGGNQAVVAGAYAYTLQHPDNNWYLQSQDCPVTGCGTPGLGSSGGPRGVTAAGDATPVSGASAVLYHPFVPVAEAYAANMARVVIDMETFRQRMGGHYDVLSSMGMFAGMPTATGSISSTQSPGFAGVPGFSGIPVALPVNSDGTPMYMWADVRGSRNSLKPSRSTTGVTSSSTDWEIRSGFDAMLWEQDDQHLMGGINVFYGGSSTETKSVYGNGDLDMRRYGVGATLTWYNDSGTYVDFQGKAMWFNNDLQADALGSLTYHAKAFGWAASVEVGHEFNITQNFTLTPQAQLTYGTINFRGFKDRFGNTYELRDSASLRGRVGIEAAYTWTATSDLGEVSETRLYGIANLYHEFRDEKKVRVAGVSLENNREKNWGGLGVGVSHTWKNGKYRIFGEVEATRSLSGHGSHGVTGRIGFVMRF